MSCHFHMLRRRRAAEAAQRAREAAQAAEEAAAKGKHEARSRQKGLQGPRKG